MNPFMDMLIRINAYFMHVYVENLLKFVNFFFQLLSSFLAEKTMV